MRPFLPWIALTLSCGGLVAACGSSSNQTTDAGTTTGDSGNDAASEGATGDDASADTGTGSDAAQGDAGTPAYLRIAQWSPDGAPVDVCVAPHGTTSFQGPLLSQLAGDAGAAGIAFPQVSAYLPLDPGHYDVRFVAAGAKSCATAVGPDATNVALASGAYETVAGVGDTTKTGSDPGLSLMATADDSVIPNSSDGEIRFINAAPSETAADMGKGSLTASDFQAILTNVSFGQVSAQAATDAGTVDGAGYLPVAPFGGATMSAHPTTGGSPGTETVASNVIVGAGDAVTFALVNGKTGGPAPQLLRCFDNNQPNGLLADCKIVSP